MRPSLAALPALFALLALPAVAAGADREVEPSTVAAAEADPVPATAGPEEAAPTAVPAAGEREVEQIAGPGAPVPGLPGPAVEPVGPETAAGGDGNVLAFRPEIVVPFGDWADVTGTGIGLHVAYDHRATDRLTWTGRLGYVVHLENEKTLGGRETDLHTHEVPLLAGVRYSPFPGLYGAVEAGLVHFRYESEVGADVDTEGGFRLGGTVGAGYRLADFNVGARLFLPDLVGRDDGVDLSTGLALEVGYSFADL